MTSRRGGFDDSDFDFEALLSDRTGRDDATLGAWAVGTDQQRPHPAGSPEPVALPEPVAPVAPPARVAHGGSSVAPRQHRRSRGQLLSWTALTLAVASSAALGYGVYDALRVLDVSINAMGRASDRLDVPTVGLVGLLLALVLAIVAVFTARPRLVATLALVLTLLLPVVCLTVGLRYGLLAVGANVADEASLAGVAVGDYVAGVLDDWGVDVGPFMPLLRRLLG